MPARPKASLSRGSWEWRGGDGIFRAPPEDMPMTTRLPIPPDQNEPSSAPRLELGELGAAVRWTLGNLDQAFDQALDEAFRTCTTILDGLESHAREGERREGAEPEGALQDGHEGLVVARFRSCEGPIPDGELGEGRGHAAC